MLYTLTNDNFMCVVGLNRKVNIKKMFYCLGQRVFVGQCGSLGMIWFLTNQIKMPSCSEVKSKYNLLLTVAVVRQGDTLVFGFF